MAGGPFRRFGGWFLRQDGPLLALHAAFLCTAFTFQPYPLHFIVLLPVLVALARARTTRDVVRRAVLAGLLAHLLTGYWVFGLLKYTWFALLVYLTGPAYVALPWIVALAAAEIVRRRTRWPMVAVLPAAWVMQEWLFRLVSFGMNLTQWSHMLSFRPWTIQFTEWTGMHGAALWIAAGNALLFDAGSALGDFRARRTAVLAASAVALAVVVPAHGFLKMRSLQQDGDSPDGAGWPTIHAVALQPNIDLDEKHEANLFRENSMSLLELIAEAGEGADLVVLPESSVPGDMSNLHSRGDAPQTGPYGFIAQRGGFHLLAGALYDRIRSPDDIEDYDLFNAAILIGPDGEVRDWNGKHFLIPFAEGLPVLDRFGVRSIPLPFDGFISQFGGISKGEFGRPLEFEPRGTTVKLGVALCSEAFIPQTTRAQVANGAELIAVMSEDTWYSVVPWFARYLVGFSVPRAIETRRTIVRSANTGISAFITRDGVVHQATGQWVRTAIRRDVPLVRYETLYVRYGEWLLAPAGAWALLAIGCAVAGGPRRRGERVGPPGSVNPPGSR